MLKMVIEYFWLNVPNSYGKCPRCDEYKFWETRCEDCGYSTESDD